MLCNGHDTQRSFPHEKGGQREGQCPMQEKHRQNYSKHFTFFQTSFLFSKYAVTMWAVEKGQAPRVVD